MATITTSAGLNVGTELILHLGYPATTIELVATGNLVAKDGVTMQALYTKLKNLWTDPAYSIYPFPMRALDVRSGQWEFGIVGKYYNGSGPHNDTTRRYIRNAGWNEYNAAGVLQRVYVGIKSFGTLAKAATQPYYQLASSDAPTDLNYTGVPNEPIKVYDLGASFDKRTYLKLYAREQGYTYDSRDLASINETATGPYSLTMSIANAVDTNITDNDATVAASAPYTGITVTWLSGNGFTAAAVGSLAVGDVRQHGNGRWSICTSAGTINAAGVANYANNGGTAVLAAFTGERLIDTTYYAYNIIVAGNNATAAKVYTKVQYLLRQNADIDSGAGTRTGKITDALMAFVGPQLVTATGVFIDNVAAADALKVTYTDVGGVGRSLPVITNQSVTITGGATGTRIQVYDLTNNLELYNGTPAFPYTWTDPNPYVADRQIRLRAAKVSGTTAKKFVDATIGTSTAAAPAVNYLLSQQDDAVYNANAVDGSTVTFLTVDDPNSLDKLNAPGGSVSLQDFYAAVMYYRSTAGGITGSIELVATDTANYALYGKKIKNVSSPAVPLKITGGWLTDGDTGNPIDAIDTAGGTIFLAPPHVVGFSYSGGGTAPTAAEVADAVWDEALAGHSTPGTAGKSLSDALDNTDATQAKVDEQ